VFVGGTRQGRGPIAVAGVSRQRGDEERKGRVNGVAGGSWISADAAADLIDSIASEPLLKHVEQSHDYLTTGDWI
jgi:4-aminobutyrate aminotransferase-like enzyme